MQLSHQRRRKRKPHELDDPTQSPNAAVNKLTVHLNGRVSRDHRDLFKRCVEGNFGTQSQALERAVELLADHLGETYEADDFNIK